MSAQLHSIAHVRTEPVMTWQLWLDDKIDDADAPARHTPAGFVGAESSVAALALVARLGPPAHMDLDHDLGGDDDALVFLRALADTHFDQPPTWATHSANPAGRVAIESFMRSWRKVHAAGR